MKAITVIIVGVPALLIVLGFFAYVGAYTLDFVSENVGMQAFGFFLILSGILIYAVELGAAVLGLSERRAVAMRCPGCGMNMIQTVNGYPNGGGIYYSPTGTSPRVTAWVCPNCGKILPIG